MSPRPAALVPLLATALALGACAKDKARYPSLSIREGERVTGAFTPVVPQKFVSLPPSAEVRDRLAQLLADAAAANQRFLAAVEEAKAPVVAARGAEPGTEEFELAEVALANVSSLRSETMVALADLDLIYAEARLEAGDLAEIEAAVSQVEGEIRAQDQAIDLLEAARGS